LTYKSTIGQIFRNFSLTLQFGKSFCGFFVKSEIAVLLGGLEPSANPPLDKQVIQPKMPRDIISRLSPVTQLVNIKLTTGFGWIGRWLFTVGEDFGWTIALCYRIGDVIAMLNKTEIKGNWNVLKGKLKEKYAQLTDNDLLYVEGKEEELLGRIQQRTGRTRREIEREIENLLPLKSR
jgi:uncharacterized protein YjbJ (UPF0337 family)